MRTLAFSTFLLMAATAIAQPTTEEEYNYVTKGYAIQTASGLDMKRGYRMEDVGEWTTPFTYAAETMEEIRLKPSRKVVLKALYREGQPQPCAWLLKYERSGASARTYTICLPTADATALWERTREVVAGLANGSDSEAMYQALFWAMAKVYSSK